MPAGTDNARPTKEASAGRSITAPVNQSGAPDKIIIKHLINSAAAEGMKLQRSQTPPRFSQNKQDLRLNLAAAIPTAETRQSRTATPRPLSLPTDLNEMFFRNRVNNRLIDSELARTTQWPEMSKTNLA